MAVQMIPLQEARQLAAGASFNIRGDSGILFNIPVNAGTMEYHAARVRRAATHAMA
jgi:hypothetical protein